VFKNWTVFNKYADTAEAHPSPSEMRYCDRCGDPFGRGDAFVRHCKEPPRECVNTSPEKAQEKREVAEREHKAFVERVERFQETGEDIGKTFAEIIKETYPDSCKKRIRQGQGQSRRSKT
jgi:ribosome-binding protein aMBF1 (putative translation factor)